jgi:hypothetical protein
MYDIKDIFKDYKMSPFFYRLIKNMARIIIIYFICKNYLFIPK